MILKQKYYVTNKQYLFQCKDFLKEVLKCTSAKSQLGFSTTASFRSSKLSFSDDGHFLKIKLPSSNEILNLHQTWLRHHCRCPICYNHTTHQRRVKLNQLLLNAKITKAKFQEYHNLECIWNDNHKSYFELDWLHQNVPKLTEKLNYPNLIEFNTPPLRISKNTKSPLNSDVEFQEFMSNENVVKKLLLNIITWGYGVILNAPETADATLSAIQRIAHQQRTFYGDGPTVTTSDLEYKDTAYTNEFLELHTDTNYFSEPMGLQVFHLLYHNGTGGLNSISDGFHAARLLYEENRFLYTLLATTPILYKYVDAGKHMYSYTDVILSHNLFTRNLERVRFNASDMGTLMEINAAHLTPLYEAMVRFTSILANQAKWITLQPGMIFFLDNWKTLHGRSEFTGQRSMASAYVGRSDWLSKARVLGII